MIRTTLPILAILTLTACAPTETTSETSEFGVDVDAIGACVRENASPGELEALGAGGDMATDTTATILSRPATQTCLEARGVDLSGFS